MLIGLAAHYDPDPEAKLGFHLPMDCYTGEIHWARWEKWLQHDPVRLIDTHFSELQKLKGLYIECGTADQFHLLWGARIMHQKLKGRSVEHEYREFNDNHSDLDYRLNEALPFLYRAINQ